MSILGILSKLVFMIKNFKFNEFCPLLKLIALIKFDAANRLYAEKSDFDHAKR